MKKFLAGALIIALLVALPTVANAAVKSGNQEVRGGIAITYDMDENTVIKLDAGFGYFVSDMIEVVVWVWVYWDDDASQEDYALAVAGLSQFATTGTSVPYVGVFAAWIGGDHADWLGDYALGAVLGCKFFMSESAIMFVEYRYTHYMDNKTNSSSDGKHEIMTGFAWLF